jgi:hypothetical protein
VSLDDPAGLEVTDVRPIRDEIERRVLQLLAELDIGPATAPDPTRRTATGTA